MLGSLLASILLATSFGTPLLKHNPNKVSGDTYSLHGAYVLRDNFAPYYTEFIDKYEDNYYSFSQNFTTGENNYYRCLFYYNSNYYYGGFDTFTLALDVHNNDCDITINLDMDDNGTGSTIIVPDADKEDADTLVSLFNYATNNNSVKYHILYINNYIRITQQDYDIFNVFYTASGNEYNTYYNGYYTFVNNWTNTFYWSVPMTFIADNNMYNVLTRLGDTNGLRAYSDAYMENNTYPHLDVYDSSGYHLKDRTVYIGGMIPNWLYDKMSIVGTWGYVPKPVEEYTFGEFLFSIMDAPVYYLYSLFNVEIFGMNLFIAFSSLITLCIVVFVIKKII